MTFRSLIAGVSAAAITLAAGSSALSQAAAPAAPALTHRPPVPNVCVLDIQGASATSTLGKYVLTRLQQLQAQATAELQGEGTALQNDARALDAARATLDQN